MTTPPVTPTAELAEQDAYDRVARAIHAGRYPNNPDQFWSVGRVREDAYTLARAAVDAWHDGQPSAHVANGAITDLANGLLHRASDAITRDEYDDPQAVVSATLAFIDALQTALAQAAQAAHEAVELEAVYDDGLSTEQEIRARAVAAAVAMDEIGADTEAVIADAVVFAAYIRDGRTVAPERRVEIHQVDGWHDVTEHRRDFPRGSAEERSDEPESVVEFGTMEIVGGSE